MISQFQSAKGVTTKMNWNAEEYHEIVPHKRLWRKNELRDNRNKSSNVERRILFQDRVIRSKKPYEPMTLNGHEMILHNVENCNMGR